MKKRPQTKSLPQKRPKRKNELGMKKGVVSRRCVFCREVKPVTELIRVARLGEEAALDPKRKAQGRGAYICKSTKCIEGAERVRGLERSLKCRVGADMYKSVLKEYKGA